MKPCGRRPVLLQQGASAEDQMVQSRPEANPMKWYQAHTTWFSETFVLRASFPEYEQFRWLSNGCHNSLGVRPQPVCGGHNGSASDSMWHHFDEGVVEIGYPSGSTNCLDFRLTTKPPATRSTWNPSGSQTKANCREYPEFMSDAAYAPPSFGYPQDGKRNQGWRAPLYWERDATDSAGRHLHSSRLVPAFGVA